MTMMMMRKRRRLEFRFAPPYLGRESEQEIEMRNHQY